MSIKKMVHLKPYYMVENMTQEGEEFELEGQRQFNAQAKIYNKEAHENFLYNFSDQFVEKVRYCVQLSIEERYRDVQVLN